MKKTTVWLFAVVMTLASAVWQRSSGPTYPVRGSVQLAGEDIAIRLTRSHETTADQPVRIPAAHPGISGEVAWRRYPTQEEWRRLPLRREGDELVAELPRQPAAGKLEYLVHLEGGGQEATFPERPAVTRFKGPVPAAVLIPHIVAMFLVMLLGNAAGLFALSGWGSYRGLTWTVFASLVLGGFLLGPAVQKYAFDAWWTGFPFGYDLTDNKTLFAGVAWAFAVWRLWRGRPARAAVVVATLATIVVFAIPHSMLGSELQWEDLPTNGQ